VYQAQPGDHTHEFRVSRLTQALAEKVDAPNMARSAVALAVQGNAFLFAFVLSPAARGGDAETIAAIHEPAADHVDQAELTELVLDGRGREAFQEAFSDGDELFETRFNSVDGGGANVGEGQHFTRMPRADLKGSGEWATHVPARATGPNAASCNSCHNLPTDDGSGLTSSNVHRDPLHSGNPGRMIQRNTPHLFGGGAVQRLAEEQTARLLATRDAALRTACDTGRTTTRRLVAKGIDFGEVTAIATGGAEAPSARRRPRGRQRDAIHGSRGSAVSACVDAAGAWYHSPFGTTLGRSGSPS